MGFASWQRYCTASSSGRKPNFAALNRGRHLCLAGRPSGWALAHILVQHNLHGCTLAYFCQGGCVFVIVGLSVFVLFVCLLATLRTNFQTDLHEIFREGWQWANEQMLKFWWQSGSQIQIQIQIQVRNALAEVCTVPVLLVFVQYLVLFIVLHIHFWFCICSIASCTTITLKVVTH